jgi:GR25 family glycosyltransferase involved in LPS biosynthesis
VRLVSFWGDPTFLANHFSRQTKGDDEWNGIRLTDDPDADVTVILNHPGHTDVQRDRSIVLHMEPLAGVATWGKWSDPNPDELLHVRTHAQFPNVAEWHLGSTWAELGGGHNSAPAIEKTRDLSVVVSNKAFDPGHKLRIAFVQHLASNNVDIDVFGRGAIDGVSNHKGELPEWDKRDGLFPYRYTIAAENFSEHNYVTEKFFDAILSECLCFYWGCPNLEQLVDPDVFVRLPLENPDDAQRIIEQSIADDLWSQRIDAIRREKQRILDEYQLFPTIERVLTGLKRFDKLPVRVINLERRPDRLVNFNERLSTSANPATASKFVRVEGTDGLDLVMTPEIEHLFRNNDFNFRRGLIGCALSHMSLWQQIADGSDDMLLIVEDDTTFVPHLRNELVDALGQLPEATDFDLAFLGSLQWETAPDRTGLAPRDRWRPMVWADFLGGTFAYFVTKAGAQKLLELVERDGIQNGIDWFPMRHGSELRVLETLPAVASAAMAWPGRSGDSDIQHDFEPVATELPPSRNSDRPTRSSRRD